jgi:hypothetical protein
VGQVNKGKSHVLVSSVLFPSPSPEWKAERSNLRTPQTWIQTELVSGMLPTKSVIFTSLSWIYDLIKSLGMFGDLRLNELESSPGLIKPAGKETSVISTTN